MVPPVVLLWIFIVRLQEASLCKLHFSTSICRLRLLHFRGGEPEVVDKGLLEPGALGQGEMPGLGHPGTERSAGALVEE